MSKKSFLSNLKISYNAPVTLTFALIAAVILLLDTFLNHQLIPAVFTCPGTSSTPAFNAGSLLDYFRLLFHIFGHSDWNHFLGNMAFILLLGPVIEERYGSKILILMMTITSLVTGVLNVCFSPSQMLGSSDIAFMMILLTSFTSISKCEIPLSFILILILYIGREILGSGENENISTLAHIAGGLCGSLFAFLATPRPKASRTEKKEKESESGKSSEDDALSKEMTPYERYKLMRLQQLDKESPRNQESVEKPSYGFANMNKKSDSTSGTKSRRTKKSEEIEEIGSIDL